jgi:hypothetical protein
LRPGSAAGWHIRSWTWVHRARQDLLISQIAKIRAVINYRIALILAFLIYAFITR